MLIQLYIWHTLLLITNYTELLKRHRPRNLIYKVARVSFHQQGGYEAAAYSIFVYLYICIIYWTACSDSRWIDKTIYCALSCLSDLFWIKLKVIPPS